MGVLLSVVEGGDVVVPAGVIVGPADEGEDVTGSLV